VAEPFLRLEGVSKQFGITQALSNVSLELGESELLIVLGPTGAGKTTLLRSIAGLEAPTSGAITMGGQNALAHSPAERDVALVFQNFSLYPDWTARKNLEFPLRAPGRALAEAVIAERVAWAARLLKIEHLLERRATRLSGGEMQRVAIGRAIVRRPKLFLMDEPLTNLDAKLREALRVELVALRRELGTPMIFVTHDQAEALSMGDRVVVLANGRVLQVGTPEQIYRAPVSPDVARQVGQPRINVIEVEPVSSSWHTRTGAKLLPCAPGHPAGPALLGIRPEDIALARTGSTPGKLELLENTGPATIAVVTWGSERLHVLLPKAAGFAVGDTVFPELARDKAVLWPRSA